MLAGQAWVSPAALPHSAPQVVSDLLAQTRVWTGKDAVNRSVEYDHVSSLSFLAA